MGSLEEEIQTIKNQKNYGIGLERKFEMANGKLVVSTTEASLNISSVRKIDHKDVANKCKLCGTHGKNVMHIVVVAC